MFYYNVFSVLIFVPARYAAVIVVYNRNRAVKGGVYRLPFPRAEIEPAVEFGFVCLRGKVGASVFLRDA